MIGAAGQRGTAVIVAMLVVALAAAAASELFMQQDIASRRIEVERDVEQARWLLAGGTLWARVILRTDARAGSVDHAGELWATGLPPTEIEQGRLAGEILDRQGLFNLNNLVRNGRASPEDIAVLQRLLGSIGLRTEIADAIADWIDADSQPWSPAGAEDEYYLRLRPPYRAANQPLATVEELLRVRGCDEEIIGRLRRYVTVLPERTAVNVNFAPPEVLAALIEGLTLPEAAAIARARVLAPFGSTAEFLKGLPRSAQGSSMMELSVESQYFLVQGQASVGKAVLHLQALVQRKGSTLPLIVWQRIS